MSRLPYRRMTIGLAVDPTVPLCVLALDFRRVHETGVQLGFGASDMLLGKDKTIPLYGNIYGAIGYLGMVPA